MPGITPIALRRVIDIEKLSSEDPCGSVRVLGSFWPNSRNSFESRIVKTFKECNPIQDNQPHITTLCNFYAELILKTIGDNKIDWVARVLASSEKEPERSRPQSLLVDTLCSHLSARNATHVFFKSQRRSSMRSIARLSGPDAIKARIQYIVQDLFIKPTDLRGNILLIDDIYNTGASMRIYAQTLKECCGAASICGINLAATRFQSGKDGHGMLKLDISTLTQPEMGMVWLDKSKIFHKDADCASAIKPVSAEIEFAAKRKGNPCPNCCAISKPKKRWWWF